MANPFDFTIDRDRPVTKGLAVSVDQLQPPGGNS